ncbi:MAG TPA: lmo0937 family membrane protein [Bryobacteraceae bacterium]|nr:lmo0937 family membrane protein [Bryobacteraceae bacterium]
MIRDFMFLILFFILLGVWFTGWLAFHVAGGMIHLLLVLAVVFLIIHFFTRRGVA